jgi:hypothetical protein
MARPVKTFVVTGNTITVATIEVEAVDEKEAIAKAEAAPSSAWQYNCDHPESLVTVEFAVER